MGSGSFCGSDGWKPIVDGRFGLCFMETWIFLSYAFFLAIGAYRFYKILITDDPKENQKLNPEQKMMFWIKFSIAVTISLIAQFQWIEQVAGLDGEQKIVASIVSDSLRTFSWAFCALILFLEYKKKLRHWKPFRIWWIIAFLVAAVKFGMISRRISQKNRSYEDEFFISFVLITLLMMAMAILGAVGLFFPRFKERFEIPKDYDRQPAGPKVSLSNIWILISPDKFIWFFATFLALVEGASQVVAFAWLSNVIAEIKKNSSFEKTGNQIGIFVAIISLNAFSAFLNIHLFGVGGMRLIQRIRTRLFNKFLAEEMSFFDEYSPGRLISYISGDTDRLGTLRLYVRQIIVLSCVVISGSVTIFTISWQLAVVILTLLVILFFEVSFRSVYITFKFMKEYSNYNAETSAKAAETLSNIGTVHLFGKEKHEQREYKFFVDETAKTGKKNIFFNALFEGVEIFLTMGFMAIGLIICFYLNRATPKLIDTDDLPKFLLVGLNMILSFKTLVSLFPLFIEAAGPTANTIKFLNRQPSIKIEDDSQSDGQIPLGTEMQVKGKSTIKGQVSWERMYFKYPREAQYTLEDFSLNVPAGQSTAFVGHSGCGKSTLINTILRFYDPPYLTDIKELNQCEFENFQIIVQRIFPFKLASLVASKTVTAPTKKSLSERVRSDVTKWRDRNDNKPIQVKTETPIPEISHFFQKLFETKKEPFKDWDDVINRGESILKKLSPEERRNLAENSDEEIDIHWIEKIVKDAREKKEILLTNQESIKIDGKPLTKINLLQWWKQIGWVPQESAIFKGTLEYNILYGAEDPKSVTEQQLNEAIERAHLTELKNEKGLQMEIGERGKGLSGGQKQRVSIARLFLKNPKIVLLDEVTSALDPETEEGVIESLKNLISPKKEEEKRTTFVVAHRLHTLTEKQGIDRIVVLKDHQIQQEGSHSELIQKDGLFKEMWSKQNSGEDLKQEYGKTIRHFSKKNQDTNIQSDRQRRREKLSPDILNLLDALEYENLSEGTLAILRNIQESQNNNPTEVYGRGPSMIGLDSYLSRAMSTTGGIRMN